CFVRARVAAGTLIHNCGTAAGRRARRSASFRCLDPGGPVLFGNQQCGVDLDTRLAGCRNESAREWIRGHRGQNRSRGSERVIQRVAFALSALAYSVSAATSTSWGVTGFSEFLKGRLSGLSLTAG